MTRNQKNRAEMFATTRSYLEANVTTWNVIPVIGIIKNELDSTIQKISHYQGAQEAAQTFLGKDKIALKRTVSAKAKILNDALVTFALIENDPVLEQKAKKSYTNLLKLSNQDFQTVINETIELLQEKVDSLSDYGISTEHIEDLKASFNDYVKISVEPRLYRVASSQATKALEELFLQANSILVDKLDRMIRQFQHVDSNFYNGYLAARVVVDN